MTLRSERDERDTKKPGQMAEDQAQVVAGAALEGVDGIAWRTRVIERAESRLEHVPIDQATQPTSG